MQEQFALFEKCGGFFTSLGLGYQRLEDTLSCVTPSCVLY